MSPLQNNSEKDISINAINKRFWPLYLLNGFQSIGFGSFVVLVVPLSLLFWPNEPYHALEIGILITTLFWSGSFAGLFIGRLVDIYSRRLIIFILSLLHGIPMLFLGFANPGQGVETWLYFVIFVFIFGSASGGMWPSVISMTDDEIPKAKRSRFFGYYEIVRNISTVTGYLIASYLVENGYWRQLFWGIGTAILIMGCIFFIRIDEPKRGAQREELAHIVQNSAEYDFKIDKKMMKETMLSRTNMVALIEGISTMILLGSINFLILPYVQSPPINISPFSTSVFLVVFGLSGGLLGSIILANLCDKIAKDHPIRRLPIIIISITGGLITFSLFFHFPWPHFSPEEGSNVLFLMSNGRIWIMGALFFTSRSIFSLYVVNQAPVLQEINLPEAQGQIVSWNQFLESLGRGIGPIICGVLLGLTQNDYPLVSTILIFFIIPGTLLWLLALRWFTDDRKTIKKILEERAEIICLQKEKEAKP
ncbi:MAG: MFS transporter [Promethearchaeia archaeon]